MRIYELISGTWTQIGQDLTGDANNIFGIGLSLSADADIVAIDAPHNTNTNGFMTGKVKIFQNIAGTWTQVGQDILGTVASETLGENLSLSSDGSVLAISAIGNNTNGSATGRVKIYRNISGSWTQVGTNIDGEGAMSMFGMGISLSSDGNVLAAGAIEGTGSSTGSTKGYVKAYDLSAVLSSNSFVKANFNVYPNPASEILNITLDNELILEKVTMYNNLGQIVKTTHDKAINVSSLAKGLYHVEVITNKGKASKKYY